MLRLLFSSSCALLIFIFSGLIWSILSPQMSLADENNSDFSLSYESGIYKKPFFLTLTPKNNKIVHWSFFSQNPSNLHSTSETTRIFVPRTRNFWIFSDTSPVEKRTFIIENQTENRFFRISTIDANPKENFLPTVTVENASLFDFSMKNWEISGKNFSLHLPNEELSAGEKRTFIAPLSLKNEEVLLISPTQRVRDRVKVPLLPQGAIYTRITPENSGKIPNPRPQFYIAEQ